MCSLRTEFLSPSVRAGPFSHPPTDCSGLGKISGTSSRVKSIIYAAGQFVAVGESGLVLTSLDGKVWEKKNGAPQGSPSAIAYGDGTYVVVAAFPFTIWLSNDLISWRSFPTLGADLVSLNGVTHHDGLFVAVGRAGGQGQPAAILTSRDGVDWERQSINIQSPIPSLNKIIYSHGSFVAVGGTPWDQPFRSIVVTSPDGKQWTQRDTAGAGILLSLVSGDGRLVAVGGGANGPILFPDTVLTSRDAISWAAVSNPPTLSGILFVNDNFIAAGDNGLLLSSTDGINWQRRATGTTANLADITSNGRVHVAVGIYGTILRSADELTWTLQACSSRVHLTGATYGNGLFTVVGGEQLNDGARRAILTSPDGITWTDHPNVSVSSLNSDSALALANAVEPAGSPGLYSAVSPNRPPQPPTSGSALYDVAFGKGRFVAVGGEVPRYQPLGQTIITSVDGFSWSGRGVLDPPALRGITFGSGLFVAVGDGQWISSSSNGTAWNQIFRPVSPGSPPLHKKVGYGAGTFVIVGASGLIETSINTTNWTTRRRASTRGLHGVAFGKGTFVAVGESGTIVQSDPLPFLLNPTYQNGAFTVSVPTLQGRRYILEFTSDLSRSAWSSLASTEGDGSVRLLSDSAAGSRERFYRLRVE